jgi:hypothetical protein
MVLLVFHALEATLATRFARLNFFTKVCLFYATDMRVDELVQM